MATQGLLSVMRGTEVLFKVVCGCDGMNVREAADAIRTLGADLSLEKVYAAAVISGMGCADCLVVVGPKGEYMRGDMSQLTPLYRAIFQKPRFNPRWGCGVVAEYAEVFLPNGDT